MATNAINPEDLYYKNKGITTSTAIMGKSANEMGMDEFFNLLVAQMTNQDMMNPKNDTEFIAQMAQFSALQGIKTVQEYQLSNYAVSYAGKAVTIAQVNETTGKIDTITGVVETVTFYDGRPKVVVNGKAYDLHTVMEVKATAGGSTVTPGSLLNEAAGYIGKTIKVKYTNTNDEEVEVTGYVDSVTLIDGKPYVMIEGKAYPASGIVGIVNDEDADSNGGDDDGDGGDNGNSELDTD